MVFCPHCKADCPAQRDSPYYVCCDVCGKVLYDDLFTDEPTFVKGPGGESRRSGVTVRSTESGYSDSFRRTLEKGVDEIRRIVLVLKISGGDSIVNPASRFYEIAVQRNFTRGRRTTQVAAACLYIACRTAEPPKPFLLIDFSETLTVNVYVLGSVFLQLCQLLNLVEHNIIKRPVDPTLFIPRFTEKLLDGRNVDVSRTAMHIIASMKRDWMQTGRKPSGLCGAALYISALSHGFKFLKSDIVKIVHICEVTLTKRLIEFESTESGSLTIEELDNNAKELTNSKLPSFGSEKSGDVLCQHKGQPHFAHGLCKSCFEDFIELSGGLEGGSDPPAFQQAERMRAAMESAKKSDESDAGFPLQNKEKPTKLVHETGENIDSFAEASQNVTKNRSNTAKFGSSSADGTTDGASDTCNKFTDASTISGADSDGLSDIDDVEVCGYLNNEEEMHYKKIIWEEMNREYLEEQAAKMEAGQGDPLSKPKPRKERRQKQDPNATPAQTAAEAARQMLSKKRFSSKINYDALEKCFSGDVAPNKKTKVANDNEEDNTSGLTRTPGDKEHESNEFNGEDQGVEDEGYGWQFEENGIECGYEDDDTNF